MTSTLPSGYLDLPLRTEAGALADMIDLCVRYHPKMQTDLDRHLKSNTDLIIRALRAYRGK